MQLTTSSGPIVVAGHDLAHQLLGGVEDRVGDSLTSTVVAPRRAKRRIGAPSCQLMARPSWSSSLLVPSSRRLRRRRQARNPAPVGARGAAHGHEPGRSRPDGAIPARFSCAAQAPAGAALRRRPAGAAELALVVVDPDAGGFVHWTVYGMAPGVRGSLDRPAGRGAPGPELDRRHGLDAAVPADAAPTATSSSSTGCARRRSSPRAPTRSRSSTRSRRAAAGRGELVGRYGRASAPDRRRGVGPLTRWAYRLHMAAVPGACGPRRPRRSARARRGPSRRTSAGAVRPSSSSTPCAASQGRASFVRSPRLPRAFRYPVPRAF